MPIILAIETSTAHGSIVLRNDDSLLSESHVRSERNHNSELFPALEEAFRILGDRKIDLILTGTGPGSYNGSRIAIAVAQGIGTVHSCPTVGLESFYGLPSVRAGKSVLICGDARRLEYYTRSAHDGLLRDDLTLASKEKFSSLVENAQTNGAEVITTDDPERLNFLKQLAVEIPTAGGLIEAWLSFNTQQKETLLKILPEPAYLRPPHITKAKPRRHLQVPRK